jgi:hypothetical protein
MIIRDKSDCKCIDANNETNKQILNKIYVFTIASYTIQEENMDNLFTVSSGRRLNPAVFSGELSSVLLRLHFVAVCYSFF